jgi:hypothetical protein
MENKIKCVVSENGFIIPIHNITLISPKDAHHCIWIAGDRHPYGHELSTKQYNALLDEIEILK